MRLTFFRLAATIAWAIGSMTAGPASAGLADPDCLVIAHRGASGYIPEHTLPAYRLAILLGADYIEPDIVWTRDGVPVVRHENQLDPTTDVADHPEFATRRSTRSIDGRETEGWFADDFSLAELRTLRARERLPELRPASALLNGLFPIPTLQEVIDLLREMESVAGRRIGLYPELKSPAYFRDRGLHPEKAIVRILAANGYSRETDPIYIQSFEADSLRRLNTLTDLRLVLLLWRDPDAPEYADEMVSTGGLEAIARYADGIGVDKYGFLIPLDQKQQLLTSAATDLPARANEAGLTVHAWTFRAENRFLPANLRRGAAPATRGNSLAEHRAFIAAGVDGLFSDQPDIARAACRAEGFD